MNFIQIDVDEEFSKLIEEKMKVGKIILHTIKIGKCLFTL